MSGTGSIKKAMDEVADLVEPTRRLIIGIAVTFLLAGILVGVAVTITGVPANVTTFLNGTPGWAIGWMLVLFGVVGTIFSLVVINVLLEIFKKYVGGGSKKKSGGSIGGAAF